jgi:NADPH-dependent 7-cyano-7-deazaguanine reductase QueF-like protein
VVAVYLNAFNEMNETSWANLKAMLESDLRLQLGATAA